MAFTSIYAEVPDFRDYMLNRTLKVEFFALFTVIVTTTWDRLRSLIWVTCFSLGFYGVKGGAYVIGTGGGSGKVWGPAGTFIEGNNELALALLMIVPLILFLIKTINRKVGRYVLGGCLFLVAVSIAGSFSRGALVASLALAVFLIARTRRSKAFILLAAVTVGFIAVVMPQSWYDRMGTIQTYEEDSSAQKRLNSWHFAWEYAKDHPIVGGGFGVFRSEEAYQKYAPRSDEGWVGLDAHNIYFQVLAEHGFVGLVLFVLVLFSAWRDLGRVIRQHQKDINEWALNSENTAALATALQGSLLAFCVGGMFLSLAYFDLPYMIIGMAVSLAFQINRASHEKPRVPSRF